jgi:hypothetical protein
MSRRFRLVNTLDYLHWWFDQNSNRGVIELEVQCHPFPKKMIAMKKLRLYDYLAAKFKEAV